MKKLQIEQMEVVSGGTIDWHSVVCSVNMIFALNGANWYTITMGVSLLYSNGCL